MDSIRKDLQPIKMRNYGRILQDIVAYATTVEDELQRRAITLYVAQCMRQKNIVWNKDPEIGEVRIKEDIKRLSDGRLDCDFEEFELMMQNPVYVPNSQQKKKKK